jgi:hypothetical protein
MGSHNTVAQHELAAEAFELDSRDWRAGHAVPHLATDHPQVRTWPDNDRNPSRERETEAEQAFDRLNPTFGVPADRSDRIGHRDVAQREAAFALGVRVAVHDSRQNDRNPIIWQPGQDYRMADALQAARTQPSRTRWGPERLGPER